MIGFYPPAPYGPTPFGVLPNNFNQDPYAAQQALPPPPYYGPPYPPQQQQQPPPHNQTINEQNHTNNPSFKLYDFESNIQSDIIRLLFSFAGVSFKDKRIKQEEWDRVKDRIPIPRLPILRVNDQCKIYYRDAIIRYLAREFRLYGTDTNDFVMIDIILELNREFQEKLFKQISTCTTIEEQREVLTQFIPDHAINYFNRLEEFYKIFDRQGQFFLGSQISLADLIVYQTINYLIDIDSKLLDNYSRLQEARHYLEKHPQLANYLNKNKSQIKKKRHRTVPPTSHNHHRHRHRSQDGHRSSHRHHSKESTPPFETNQESNIHSKEQETPPHSPTNKEFKLSNIQSEEKTSTLPQTTEGISSTSTVVEAKSEHIHD